MSRPITVALPLPPGDHAAIFRGSPDVWLPAPRAAGLNRWRIHLHVAGIEREVLCQVGDPWSTPTGLRRRVTWTPLGTEGDVIPMERLLPTLHGELHLAGEVATPSLLLDGWVDVPLGRFGEAVDALVLGRVAHRTASSFLWEVGRRLVGSDDDATTQPAADGIHQRS